MAAVLADTHAILWYLTADARISRAVTAALDQATTAGDPIFVSAITMVEIQYLVERGRCLSAGVLRLHHTVSHEDEPFPARGGR
jgi:PIN domain nuclease of toxin-antitoxin system